MQLAESQVNASALVEVFGSAFMDIDNFKGDSFKVSGEKIPISVQVDTDRKLIKFSFYNVLKNINIAQAAAIINKMNEDYIFVKFSAVEYEDSIFYSASYFMSYKKGLIKFQLVDNIKAFERITLEAGLEELGEYF